MIIKACLTSEENYIEIWRSDAYRKTKNIWRSDAYRKIKKSVHRTVGNEIPTSWIGRFGKFGSITLYQELKNDIRQYVSPIGRSVRTD